MNVSKSKTIGDPFRKHSMVRLHLADQSDAAAARGRNGDWLKRAPSADPKRLLSDWIELMLEGSHAPSGPDDSYLEKRVREEVEASASAFKFRVCRS